MADLLNILMVLAIPIIIAITFHEAAHGWVAMKLGDDTAHRLGRVTFNPIKHIDPIGTLLVPTLMFFTSGFLFGWAKPVPVNFGRLRDPRRDMIWVALAGPGVNIALALFSVWLMRWLPLVPVDLRETMWQILEVSVLINVILAAFNMIPLPPLDGGRVAVGLLPKPLARHLAKVEPYGLLILIGVLFIVPMVGAQLGENWNLFLWALPHLLSAIGEATHWLLNPI